MKFVKELLNSITMYRLVVYVLGGIIAYATMLSFLGRLPASPTSLVISLSLLLTSTYVIDRGLGAVFKIPVNMESSLITALILCLIIDPARSVPAGLCLLLAGAVSSASKFTLNWRNKHIFNPAALAAAVLSVSGLHAVTWWVGSSALWPVTLVLGAAIVYKIKRVPLVICFMLVAASLQLLLFAHNHQALATNMHHALLASPFIFLGTIMLTEPATMPPQRNLQLVFAALVATLYITGWKIGPLIIYPEVALLIGNVFAFAVSPKFRVRLHLKEIQKISDRVYSYVFQPEERFNFLPGQYMEWTLADIPYDSRGNRRTFTIASSPTEPDVQLGLKYYEPASTYKAAFFSMQPGDTIFASQLAGNFTLQGNEHKKLALIAGGIGITPFRSMIKYLIDANIASDIVVLYVVSNPQEFAYVQELRDAAAVGVKTIPIVTDLAYRAKGVVSAKVTPELISQLIPDYNERMFYISGPNTMVDACKKYIRDLGIARRHIKTDHFSGY